MKKLATLMAIVAVAGLMLVGAPQDAQARPQYKTAFEKKYSKVAEEMKNEAKCNGCHGLAADGKSDKKLLSDYATALKDALGKKNEREADLINKAFDAVAQKKNGDGKPYGELLEGGKLPAPHESIKK
jgi:hypothetical protein